MASVRGPDPCLAAGSDPDCVTTNRDRDTTNVGTGPGWLPWPLCKKEKEMANTGIEKDRPTPKKDTPIPKKEVRIAFAFCFCTCFLLYTFLL